MRRRTRQLDLRFHPRGGARPNAGRKAKGAKAGVSHLRRQRFARLLPVHVTLRMARHVYNLRGQRAFSIIARAMAVAAERFGMRIVQFAIEGNHVHLIVEAESNVALSRAMQGFSIRVAKRLNAMMNKRGRVLADRYHAHALRTPTEARRAVAYVRNNHRKHMAQVGERLSALYIDRCSSEGAPLELPRPHTWLLRTSTSPPS
jgi:REP element-mobilizing transposase RayT